MKHFRFLLAICLLSLVSNLFAQTTPNKPVKQCNAQLARQLIEQQTDFSNIIGETDKRINVLIKVADFLWTSDEETARRYFADAFKFAQDLYHDKDIEKSENRSLVSSQPDYRFKVITAIAGHDGQWAKRLTETVLKEFDEDKGKDKRDSFDQDREIQQLLGIAAKVAKDNPDLALSLARRVMRYSLTHFWYSSLFQIAENNQPLADSIYSELLNNYSDTEVYRLLYLSAYPFGRARIFGIERYNLDSSLPANFSSNQNLERQFLTTLFRRISRLSHENTSKSILTETPELAVAVTALNELEPTVSQQFPELIQLFSQAKVQAISNVSIEVMDFANKRGETDRNFNNPFAEKLKDIEKADAEGKLTDYQIYKLALSARKEENFKAAENWLDKMQEEKARLDTVNYFYFKRSKLAVKERRFDEAKKYAEKIGKIEHRAVLYFDIAEAKLREPNTKYESLDALWEVYQMAAKAPDSVEKAQVLMGLANMYEKINHSNALDSLSLAVKTANTLNSHNLFSSSQIQQINGRNFGFSFVYDVPGFDINKTFYEVSRNDFLGALTWAESFTDRYVRALAVIAVVKDCEKSMKPVQPKIKKIS